ncbi:MAG: hypothetical protein HFH88_10260 [Lachnospiraceae bacterium]|nr:hypothetical protein [Lachnospiraceae bacterium]
MDNKKNSDAIELFNDQMKHEILDAPIDEASRDYLLDQLNETYIMVKETYIS